jgi:hypothetical protein
MLESAPHALRDRNRTASRAGYMTISRQGSSYAVAIRGSLEFLANMPAVMGHERGRSHTLSHTAYRPEE